MRTPKSLAEQRWGRVRGELLRGCGAMPYRFRACALEPPFDVFDRNAMTAWDLMVNGWEAPYQGTWWDRARRRFQPEEVGPFSTYADGERSDISTVTIIPHAEDEVTAAKAEQFLLALGSLREPASFELFGIGESRVRPDAAPSITVRVAAHENDVPSILSQLQAQYPRSGFEVMGSWGDDEEWNARLHVKHHEATLVASVFLPRPYCCPIRTYAKYDTDPLGVALAAMDALGRDEWAILQVLFIRCRQPWEDNVRAALLHPYKPKQAVAEDIGIKTLEAKLSDPLFAVQVRLAANTLQAFDGLRAWAAQYQSADNGFEILDAATWASIWPDLEPFPPTWHGEMLHFREAYWPGLILNAKELAGIVHLPSPNAFSERLRRGRTQTKASPRVPPHRGAVVLGENMHRGVTTPVLLPEDVRSRHVYVVGASGTGKSTLLLNLIAQDIDAGEGVCVLDPHGDLVTETLRRIPKHLIADTIYFNPSDTEYPVGFNILADQNEPERTVSEIVTAFRKHFSDGWGPRLEHILAHTIYTAVLTPGATLREVRRLLVDPAYRNEVVGTLRHESLVEFWRTEFPSLPRNACDPILNKLGPFLLSRAVSSIICQPASRINFDEILAGRKVFLANLSTGLLTEGIAGVIGMFLVNKITNAAFRRARMPRDARPRFNLYIDEFQAFTSAEIGFDRILSEARKYNLVLTMANQYVRQLAEVRHALLGNVGTLIAFRLGTEDAQLLAKEFNTFTVEDILNLDRGQAVMRCGSSSRAFNLRTYREPSCEKEDPSSLIIRETRRQYGSTATLFTLPPRAVGPRASGPEPDMDFVS